MLPDCPATQGSFHKRFTRYTKGEGHATSAVLQFTPQSDNGLRIDARRHLKRCGTCNEIYVASANTVARKRCDGSGQAAQSPDLPAAGGSQIRTV
jgi:predicted anti-sigma-YlaC factor YlaD